jgi:hypothetical protein
VLNGGHVFPLQVAILLSEPFHDFEGGEFVLTEQRPRMQSRASVVPLRQGDGVVFAVHHRLVRGVRSSYRVNLRHGVSEIRSSRYTLGINHAARQHAPSRFDDHRETNAHGDGLARRFRSTRSDVEVADSKPEAVGSKR